MNNDQPEKTPPEAAVRYSVGELAEAADVSRRAVRFYVQRDLLPAPIGVGRGAYYTAAHLERLIALKQLQGGGMSLEDVGQALDGGEVPAAPAKVAAASVAPEAWLRVVVAPGVELTLKAGAVAPDVVADMVEALRDRLATHSKEAAAQAVVAERRGGYDDDDRS